jgi:hypothetical protein
MPVSRMVRRDASQLERRVLLTDLRGVEFLVSGFGFLALTPLWITDNVYMTTEMHAETFQ